MAFWQNSMRWETLVSWVEFHHSLDFPIDTLMLTPQCSGWSPPQRWSFPVLFPNSYLRFHDPFAFQASHVKGNLVICILLDLLCFSLNMISSCNHFSAIILFCCSLWLNNNTLLCICTFSLSTHQFPCISVIYWLTASDIYPGIV